MKRFFTIVVFGLAPLLFSSQGLLAQTATYSWSGYTAGATSYTTGIMTTTVTLTNVAMSYTSPQYYAAAAVGSGQCGIAGGLALEAMFGNITNAAITLTMSFTNAGGQNGTCASVQFNIEDINADESVQTFDDIVVISGVDANGTAIPAANITLTLGSNVTSATAGTTKVLTGHNSGAYGSRSSTACNITSVTVTPPAGVPLTSVTILYHPDYSACASCYYNFTGPNRPAYQYISIGPINATTTGGSGCTIMLPIELASFSGKCNGIKKTLTWSTASELNNAYFTLEHSKDGFTFEELAKVKGSGNSQKVIDYAYSFNEEQADYKYYRLTQTDMNGRSQQLKTIYLNSLLKFEHLKLFPNPAKDNVKLFFNASEQVAARVNVTDLTGRVIKTLSLPALFGENEAELSVDDLLPGVYFIQVNEEGNSSGGHYLKFIKEEK